MHLGPEEKLVLSIAKASVEEEESAIGNFFKYNHSKLNWDKLLRLIILHDLGPYAYKFLKRNLDLFPANIRRSLEVNFYFAQIRNQIFGEEFRWLSKKFNQAEIDFAPIKGLSFLFSDESLGFLRPMEDLDVLVRKEQLESAVNLLLSLGYQKSLGGLKEKYWRKKQYHLMFDREGDTAFHFHLELHWALDFEKGYGPMLPFLWKRTREVMSNGCRLRLLSNEDVLFCLALHNRHFGRLFSLKYVYDVGRLMGRNKIDFDYLLEEAINGRMLSCMYFLLAQVHLLLGETGLLLWLEKWPIPMWEKRIINKFILQNIFSGQTGKKELEKNTYLKTHFLLYDSLWEPIKYIINIPQEQFAKFYDLPPYDKKTNLFYKLRPLYILFSKLKEKR